MLSKKIRLRRSDAVAASASIPLIASPAFAGPVEDVGALVASLGTLAGAATTVVLLAMGARIAIKIVNRVSVKG